MKRLFTIFVLLALLMLGVAPARAQTDPVTFHISFGEDVDPDLYLYDDYTIEHGVVGAPGNPADAMQGVSVFDSGSTYLARVFIWIVIPAGCEWKNLTYDYQYRNSSSSATGHGHSFVWYDDELTPVHSTIPTFVAGVEDTWINRTQPAVVSGAAFLRMSLWTVYSTSSSSGGYYRLDNVRFVCEGIDEPPPPPEETDLYQPITVPAQVDVLTPMEGGDITGASRITAEVTNPPLFPGQVQVYASINAEVASMRSTGRGTYNVILTGEVEGDLWVVTLNNLSRVYVEVGDMVEAGCVIGMAGPLTGPIDFAFDDPSLARQIYFSVRNTVTTEFIDWTEFASPSGDTLCAQDETSCINRNPGLTSGGEFWTPTLGVSSSQNVVFSDQGALLPPGASISQNLLLPEAGEWDLTVSVIPDLPYTTPGTIFASVKVDLGNASVTEPLTLGLAEATTLVIGPLDPTSPSIVPDIYRLRITNQPVSSDRLVPLKIQFACLSPTGVTGPPGACYFMDPEFNDGAGWTLSPGAALIDSTTIFSDKNSFIRLPVDEFVYAPFTLSGYASAAAVYRVTVWGNATVLDIDDESMLRVAFNATDDDGDFVQDMEVNPGLASTWNKETTTYTVAAGETFTGDFFLYNWTDEDFPDTNINIDSVCLEPVNGVWPDYEDLAPLPYVPEGCARVPIPPISNDVATWVAWVGALIRYFWTCQAPLWVNSIIQNIQGVQDWLALLGRWLAIVMFDMGQFMWALTQFAIYTLYNLIAGLVEEIWSVSSGAITLPWDGFSLLMSLLWIAFIGVVGLIWALLTALIGLAWSLFLSLVGLLWGVFSALVVAFWTAIINLPLIDLFAFGATITSLLFGLIAEVLALIVTSFQVLLTLAQIVGTFFTAIQVGFNGETSTDIGLVDCTTMLSTDPLFGICIGLDLVQYTIDAFPVLGIILVLLMGVVGFNTLRLTIDWTRQAFAEAS